ncbi:hypothetical protein BK708_11820 [Bacillus thuringiensis serovar yunnanensis]|nr:hypothetical protein BK708_11820 [Bacillus thuringiensis serovar yunnanensis]
MDLFTHTAAKLIKLNNTSDHGKDFVPNCFNNKPPTIPSPETARLKTVTNIDFATSAPLPTASAIAVWDSVADPPKVIP